MTGGKKIKNKFGRFGNWLRWLFRSKEAKIDQSEKKEPKLQEAIVKPVNTHDSAGFAYERNKGNRKLKILMIGWELPPHNSGGLGVACHDLCESIASTGSAIITFTLPYDIGISFPFMEIVSCGGNSSKEAGAKSPPTSSYPPRSNGNQTEATSLEGDLITKVEKYASNIEIATKNTTFDIIHAHDWLCFKAGIRAKELTGKPLIVHVHSTEFDRSGGGFIYQRIADIEKEGLEKADKVVTVSNLTKEQIVKNYHIDPSKIEVVHNGVSYKWNEIATSDLSALKKVGKKIVLFVGRMTIQKGPDYFLKAAKKVAENMDEAVFVMVGAGDMERQIIEEAASLGLSDRIFFTGFVSVEERNALYKSADAYVMPSVSEPFGIVALESLINRTPIIISKQSGVSETVHHALKVDFWNTDEMAEKIIAVLKHKSLKNTLGSKGSEEVKSITWDKAAQKCAKVYLQLTDKNN